MQASARTATLMLTLTALVASLAISSSQALEENDKKLKKGKVIGFLTKKGRNYIEVKAFGEVKARKYFPHWKGVV